MELTNNQIVKDPEGGLGGPNPLPAIRPVGTFTKVEPLWTASKSVRVVFLGELLYMSELLWHNMAGFFGYFYNMPIQWVLYLAVNLQ